MMNIIDLFAGCGGLAEGFLQTNKYNTIATIDWELPTVNTIKNRLKNKWNYDLAKNNILYFDIQRTNELLNGYNDSKFGSSIGLNKIINNSKIDLVIGGPPCQAYSIAGRVRDKDGMKYDYRNYLFESYVKIVNHIKPNAFVFENVEGILSAKPGGISITDKIKLVFNEINYELTDNLRENALFDTSFYGVPQKRKRVIIYGVKKSKSSTEQIRAFYNLMEHKKQVKPQKVKTVFENLTKFYPLNGNSLPRQSHTIKNNDATTISNHVPRFHNKRDIKVFNILANDIKQGIFKYTSSKALINLYKEITGKETNFHKYHVIREDKPSNTIPAHLYKDGLRHIHPDPEQARSITVREAARIQTFDDDFEFLGSMGDQYKMIGNAVPPKFSKLIAETIAEINNN